MTDFSVLTWLHCTKQLRSKTVVRHGQRKEVPQGDCWVFCPLQQYPRDRVSTKTCETCQHFKGFSKIEVSLGDIPPLWQPSKLDKTDKINRIIITDKMLDDLDKKQKKWRENEQND